MRYITRLQDQKVEVKGRENTAC